MSGEKKLLRLVAVILFIYISVNMKLCYTVEYKKSFLTSFSSNYVMCVFSNNMQKYFFSTNFSVTLYQSIPF